MLFLELNGYRFTANEEGATRAIFGLAAGKLDEAAFTSWLRANVTPPRCCFVCGARAFLFWWLLVDSAGPAETRMNENKRPIGVTIIACIYISVGSVGVVYHFRDLLRRAGFGWDAVLVEVSEFLAILFGALMLGAGTGPAGALLRGCYFT